MKLESDNQNNELNKNEEYEIPLHYNDVMIETFQSQIKDGVLKIENCSKLQSLQFIGFLNINNLEIQDCKNMIPQLKSQTINQLTIKYCHVQSMQDFELENLKVLVLTNLDQQFSLAQEIVKYQQLNLLCLHNLKVDLNFLAQLTNITQLDLQLCKIHSTKALQSLVNLVEVHLSFNENIDITTLQHLTKLNILSLRQCCLVNLDSLQPLTQLQELNIMVNQIVYIMPLAGLKQLSKLQAGNNKIIDIISMEQHPNFQQYDFKFQKQPTLQQLKTANVMGNINYPTNVLKILHKQSRQLKSQNNTFRKIITKYLQNQHDQYSIFIAKAVSLFQNMTTIESYQ
ncbi:leucine-rich_repeat domain-containing protein [Hexamita inflata]|uniref:Partial n=1 Tax=Hexamita inflata TaxID=28002 RepID=A0ABP1IKW1_9EUKA